MSETWVFHRGALGDSVLLWPMLRALTARGDAVRLVSDRAKARLAADVIGVAAEDEDDPELRRLWSAEACSGRAHHAARLVVSFWSGAWERNARIMFPNAEIRVIAEQLDRRVALRLAGEFRDAPGHDAAMPAPVESEGGSVALHVGAGSPERRWPMDRWIALAERLRERPPRCVHGARMIAGEAEHDRFTRSDRAAFVAARGEFLASLQELAATLGSARVVVAGDTGPGHLASALGVRTVSLFGPSDPVRWAPIGPRVRVVSPAKPRPMDWLDVDRVEASVRDA